MRWLLVGWLMLAAACEFEGPASPDVSGDGDGDGDGGQLPCDFSSHVPDTCMIGTPLAPPRFEPGTYTLDTDTGALVGPDQELQTVPLLTSGALRSAIWFVESFTLPAGVTLEVEGDDALLLLSDSSIAVAGVIDVSSDRGGRTGPGASLDSCDGTDGNDDGGGASGGGGGGFQGRGGDGGPSDNNGGVQPAAPGGEPTEIPAEPLAGCRGGRGGEGRATRAPRAPGGGAVQLTARSSIAIAGAVDAGGAGGDGSTADGGGAGGGSGGYIGLEAASIEVTGVLAANGGGGGGGAGDPPSMFGGDGGATAQATGGMAPPSGSRGAPGSWQGSLPGTSVVDIEPNTPNGGSGGGGGGAGWIVVFGEITGGGMITPPAVTAP